ncbi:MAG TPA: NAD-glutamate dehydrogenase, partial [Pseudonocardiaceae bacterium]|nr:NAD-glutamate dehydrogenase [Pseudonocardiaceae bacterium]
MGLDELISRYYQHVSGDALDVAEHAELVAPVRSHCALAADRAPGRAMVRLLNPTLSDDGWSTPGTVLQIVTDDMPYLVDSVVSQLDRLGLSVRRLVHPIVVVRRDLTGALREVLAGCDPQEAPPDTLIESWMYLELDRRVDAERAVEVQQRLLAVLTDVREVVEDTERMAATAAALADELTSTPPPLPAEEVSEGAALLRWLVERHFTFLGYRHYELVDEPAEGPENGPGPVPALRAVLASGLGVLRRDSLAARSFTTGPEVAEALSPDLLVLTQASAPATVYRPVCPYYIGVKTFNEHGKVTGEHRFLGVLTTTALHEDVLDIPVIRQRVLEVIRRAGIPLESYSGQRMLEVLQTYPRAELFSTDPRALYATVTGVLSLTRQRALRLFCRRDPYRRFFSCLVYLPRDRYTTTARLAMQDVLTRELRGTGLDYSARVGEAMHARVHFIVNTDPTDPRVPTEPDVPALTALLEDAIRTWDDRLLDAVPDDPAATELVQRYATAFPEAYKEDFDAPTALSDIRRLEALAEHDGLDLCFYRPDGAEPEQWRFTLYLARQRITLSQVLPLLQQMDVEVVDERPYPVTRSDGVQCWIYDFGLRLDSALLAQVSKQDAADVERRFKDAFVAAWRGACEVDRFNALVLRAGLDWRQAAVLRAYVRYLRQAGIPYSAEYVEDVLLTHSAIAAALVAMFEARFDPGPAADVRDARYDQVAVEVTAMV